jgi:hypothetical protein
MRTNRPTTAAILPEAAETRADISRPRKLSETTKTNVSNKTEDKAKERHNTAMLYPEEMNAS